MVRTKAAWIAAAVVFLGACDRGPTMLDSHGDQGLNPDVSPSSVVVESFGPYEIWTWTDGDGDSYRLEHEYDQSDRLIRQTAFRNGGKVGNVRVSWSWNHHSYTAVAENEYHDWIRYNEQFEEIGSSYGDGCGTKRVCDPNAEPDGGVTRQSDGAHPCDGKWDNFAYASFWMVNHSAAMIARTRQRVPNSSELIMYGGSISVWFWAFFEWDRCVKQHGLPRGPRGPSASIDTQCVHAFA